MDYKIETVGHLTQRYETVGDYWWPRDKLTQVRVSDMSNEGYELCVMIHEMIEAHLCALRGITDEVITKYDEAFNIKLAEGSVDENSEPGDQEDCPYHKEHVAATAVEKAVAEALGINWDEYDKAVMAM